MVGITKLRKIFYLPESIHGVADVQATKRAGAQATIVRTYKQLILVTIIHFNNLCRLRLTLPSITYIRVE